MKKEWLLVAVAALFINGTASVGALAEEDYKMPKESWLTGMQNKLPAILCAEGSYFRSCFDVSAAECFEYAETAAKACVNQHATNIPDPVSDEAYWRNEVGQCAAFSYRDSLSAKKLTAGACSTPTAWFK